MVNPPSQLITTDLDPIIISSPTPRSGTTLVQRLLCSAPGFLIFGENCFADLETFFGVYRNRSLMYAHYQRWIEATRKQSIDDNSDEWIANLMPDIPGYVDAMGLGSFAGLEYCRKYAKEQGRPSWGFKYPGLRVLDIQMLLSTMPACKLVYIYRCATECVRSAKSHELISSVEEITEFCQSWAVNLSYVLKIADQTNVCLLDYSELKRDREGFVIRIEAFTGALDIDRKVLDKKVNNRTLESASIYVEPAELSDKETAIIEGITQPVQVEVEHRRSANNHAVTTSEIMQ